MRSITSLTIRLIPLCFISLSLHRLTASRAFVPLSIEKHQKEWMGKNEQENFEQQHDPEIVKTQVMPEIEENVKVLVDEIIDIELGNLRMKYKLKKKKKKGGKKKKKKAKKAKKVPGARLCKNRDPRDMLAEVTILTTER